MCLVRYELGFYIPQDDVLHSHHHKKTQNITYLLTSLLKTSYLNSLADTETNRILTH
jgi:hypothetical protein